jgi:hypothetical protein
MNIRMRGLLLMAIQAALVLSAAGKYEWERHTRPTVWVRAEPFGTVPDMKQTLGGEGRYGQLQLHVDACGLSRAESEEEYQPDSMKPAGKHRILRSDVRTIAQGGRLVAVDAGQIHSADVQSIEWDMRQPCKNARLQSNVEVYLPRGVKVPYTLKPGETLWALVTVPASGPPRPVQLAISDATGFHPWKSQ